MTAGARVAIAMLAATAGCASSRPIPVPGAPPREYRAHYTSAQPELTPGSLDAGAWAAAPWTEDFVDIEGPVKPMPSYRTRCKMLWDESNLYVAAEIADPDLWATLSKHDEIVFHDNDFEVFIDPDGDTCEYYEIEVNALGTIFDLYLHQTYRAGGPAVHAWDCAGLMAQIDLRGTLNDPRNVDAGWAVQLTIPWESLQPPRTPELAGRAGFGEAQRSGAAPEPGSIWHVNFSRVQWRHQYEALDAAGARVPGKSAARAGSGPSQYRKVVGLPEDNWVWSPQWTVDMHLPQFWGHVQFVR